MDYCCGVEVSLDQSGVCVVDASGVIVRQAMVSSDPDALSAARSVLHRGFRGFERKVRPLARRGDRARLQHAPWRHEMTTRS